MAEKPSFKRAFRKKCCIIIACVFYEWRKVDGKKPLYCIKMADDAPMPFAGIWETWKSPEGEATETCAILTTNANATVAPIHVRMP